MADHLHIDFETRAVLDLKRTGVYRYALDCWTDLWCAAYAFDNGPVEVWRPGEPCPEAVAVHVLAGKPVFAWNAQFERVIWKAILARRYGWPEPKLAQWYDPMVWALVMAMPAQLGQFGQAMALHMQKDDAGRRLMLQMAKPRKILDNGTPIWWDQPEKRARLEAYCRKDVESEREACSRLLPLTNTEHANWLIDQRINDRGIRVDLDFVAQAQRVVGKRIAKLDARMQALTNGAVDACSNVAALGQWMLRQGFPQPSLDKEAVTDLLDQPLPGFIKEALLLRQQAGKASNAKLTAMENAVCSDGRIRGVFQFHKATTGRWASTIVQLHNLPRGKKQHQKHHDDLCEAIATGDDDWVEMVFGDPLDAVSSALRSCLVAAPGKLLVVRDFSAIEARVLAWLAGEQWKLEAFRAYDAGVGDDQYRLAYARAFNSPVEDVNDAERQIGKVMELALGYGGGVGAFVSMAKVYGLDLAELADKVLDVIEVSLLRDAEEAHSQRGSEDMDPREWVACEALKIAWRRAHPATVRLWRGLEDAAIAAVENPGRMFSVDPIGIRYRVANGHLWCRLPSGRNLCYPFPGISMRPAPWKDDEGKPAKKKTLTYMGISPFTKQWERQVSYGGHLTENVDQAVSADFQRAAIADCERAGLPVVLHVHDETVAEVAEDDAPEALERMGTIMRAERGWSEGCPIASAGFITRRYRKG